jgi:hypothetical protein
MRKEVFPLTVGLPCPSAALIVIVTVSYLALLSSPLLIFGGLMFSPFGAGVEY